MKNKIIRIIAIIILATFAWFIFFIVPPKTILKDNGQVDNGVTDIELWHIDTFEGGTGSRYNFLQNISKQFQKQSGIRVTVKNHTLYSATQNFNSGIYPDMLSYGNGAPVPYAVLKKMNLSYCEVGGYDGGVYAAIWCGGGYVRIVRKGIEKVGGVIISAQQFTQPLLAYCLTGDCSLACYIELESTEAVYEFYRRKDYALIATQRDLFRLENKGIEVDVEVLEAYNDLFQYISILSYEKERQIADNRFIAYLLGEEAQVQLEKIGMCSYVFDNSISGGVMQPFNGISLKSFSYCTDCFYSAEKLFELKKMCAEYDKNSKNIKNALKCLK